MSDFRSIRFREEVLDYIRTCEFLLSTTLGPDKSPLSEEELKIVLYYTGEVAKTLTPLVRTQK